MGTVVVTGGAGFIGANLVRKLIHLGYEPVVLDNFSTGLSTNVSDLLCTVKVGPLEDFQFVRQVIRDAEYVFHLGALGSVPRSITNPRATFESNTLATFNVLECVREFGIPMAFSSSSSVFGSNAELPKCENMWTNPITPYGASKLAGESLVTGYANSYNLNLVCYRLFNVFGPWQRPDHVYSAVIPKWCWLAMNDQEIEVFGDGSVTRDFTYVSVVTDVLIEGMNRRIKHKSPINLAYGKRISLLDVIQSIETILGKSIKVKFSPRRPGDIEHSRNDPTLLKSLFPNVADVDFETGLERTVDWIKWLIFSQKFPSKTEV